LNHVLITGGCGFIGVNLVRFLLDNTSWDLNILDNLSSGGYGYLDDLKDESRINLYKGDICNVADVKQSIRGCDAIVHLAGNAGVFNSNSQSILKNNVVGLVNLLDASVRYNCNRFVFSSSNAVLGDQVPPLHSDMPSFPLSLYGASKMAGESFVHAYSASFGLKSAVLRLSNVYGPYSNHKNSVVHHFIRQCIKNEKLTIFGDGLQCRDFIYAEDVCRAIFNCLLKDNIDGIFHIGSGVGTYIKKLAYMISNLKESNYPIIYGDARKGEVDSSFVDCSHAKSVLNFECSVGLERGLGLTWRWFNDKANSLRVKERVG